MKIQIDEQIIEIFDEDKNIVDVAKRAGIGIPAPCYNDNLKAGCCKVCVIEIDGQQKHACATKPEDGMNIIYKRDDLNKLRKERVIKYIEGESEPCNCNCGSGSDCC